VQRRKYFQYWRHSFGTLTNVALGYIIDRERAETKRNGLEHVAEPPYTTTSSAPQLFPVIYETDIIPKLAGMMLSEKEIRKHYLFIFQQYLFSADLLYDIDNGMEILNHKECLPQLRFINGFYPNFRHLDALWRTEAAISLGRKHMAFKITNLIRFAAARTKYLKQRKSAIFIQQWYRSAMADKRQRQFEASVAFVVEQLRAQLLFWFSDENLRGDRYMYEVQCAHGGVVPYETLANFNRTLEIIGSFRADENATRTLLIRAAESVPQPSNLYCTEVGIGRVEWCSGTSIYEPPQAPSPESHDNGQKHFYHQQQPQPPQQQQLQPQPPPVPVPPSTFEEYMAMRRNYEYEWHRYNEWHRYHQWRQHYEHQQQMYWDFVQGGNGYNR
jgi:hypothetical protein